MAWFKKKRDPVTARSRALNSQIARLEQEIRDLDARLARGEAPSAPRVRPAAHPHGGAPHAIPAVANPPPEPIFEDMHAQRQRLEAAEPVATPQHFNELGVRKFDLPALLARVRNHFRSPSASNPRLVSYLAAGNIHGLRPMRYEKRVARNRVIALAVFLFLILLGILIMYLKSKPN
jgi:hypothetical protein